MLYQDNFDAGLNWYEHDDDTAKLAYDQGRYRLVVKKANGVVLSDTSFRGGVYGEPLTALTDVSVRVRALPASPGAIFGLFCRYGPTGEYYQAVLRTDGEALILKSLQPGVTTLGRGRVSDVGTGREVRLRLDCTGGEKTRVALWADDEKVTEAEDEDGLRYGSVGMMVSADDPPADVLFEDFVLLGQRRQT